MDVRAHPGKGDGMEKRGVAFVLFFAMLYAAGPGTDANPAEADPTKDDPFIKELKNIAGKREKCGADFAHTEKKEKTVASAGGKTAGQRNGMEIPKLPSAAAGENGGFDPDLYISLKHLPAIPDDPVDPELYLSLKKIVLPMPENYAQAYLKMKTLLNPAKKYVNVHIDKSKQKMTIYLDNTALRNTTDTQCHIQSE